MQAAINAATSYLPTDLPIPPTYSKTNPADAPVLTLALTSKSVVAVADRGPGRCAPLPEDLAALRRRSRHHPGRDRSRRCASRSTRWPSLPSVSPSEQIRSAHHEPPASTAPRAALNGPQQSFTIDANDQLTTADQYQKIVVVAYRNGAAVLLQVTWPKVTNGVENARLAAWVKETPAILVNIQRQSNANTIKVVDSIKALLPAAAVEPCRRRSTCRSSAIAPPRCARRSRTWRWS